MPVRKGRTHGAFNKNNAEGWAWVESRCSTTNDVKCAHAAVLEASAECGDSAKFFKTGSETWKWIGFTLVIVSAASTAVGASATVANSKIWSTLGGTTGLGAVTTTVNSNVTADQNAVASVNTTLDSLNAAVANAGKDYDKIYLIASIYAGKCAAIANSSSGTTPPTTSAQPTKPGAPTIGTATPGTGQVSGSLHTSHRWRSGHLLHGRCKRRNDFNGNCQPNHSDRTKQYKVLYVYRHGDQFGRYGPSVRCIGSS